MNLDLLTPFLGWCTVINVGLLALFTLLLGLFGSSVTAIHARLFGMDAKALKEHYFRFLANYKLLITVFNLVPWIALQILR